MYKKRLKIALAVLDAVRGRFPDIQEFIDSTLKEECQKEKMTADEVIFLLLNLKKKKSLDKHWINFVVTSKILKAFIIMLKFVRSNYLIYVY